MVSALEAESSVTAQTTLYVGGQLLGRGTLCITQQALTWNEDTKNLGFSLQYPNISLHAIRREPIPSLYMMIDHKLDLPEGLFLPEEPAIERDSGEESDGEYQDQDHHLATELMFAPNDLDLIEKLFTAMSTNQALHPDPNDSFSEEDDDIYEDASGVIDDDGSDPIQQPMEDAEGPVEEEMEGLHIESNNGHQSKNGGDMDCDPDQFADD